ncbi:MAG: molybdopterin-dependent oxidoreductase, partial [Candidatus Binatia bacterium]|nr:molybdopterin-dependent oxidoreductase [Candidatus Binatia bacterium]
SDFAPHSTIAAGSQALRSMGSAAKYAAEEASKQIKEVAADKLEADANDLVLEDNRVFVKGTPEKGLTLGQVAQLSMTHKRGPIISANSFSQFPEQPACSTHVADVEVDPETGAVKILRYVAVQDVGRAINPLSVKGQTQGAIMQGLGQAMSEAITFGNGKVLNPSFLDYKIFSSLDAPEVEIYFVERPADNGPFGAKGTGEPPILPPVGAMANAIYDAVGVRIHELPLSPENVVKAIREKNGNRI